MIKEFIIAIALGTVVGFGATLGYQQLNHKNRPPQLNSPTPTHLDTSQNSPTPVIPNHFLTIIKPTNEIVVSQPNLVVEGLTTPASHIIINANNTALSVNSDDSGNFSAEIEIEAGLNIVQISSFSPTEEQINQQLLITLSTIDF